MKELLKIDYHVRIMSTNDQNPANPDPPIQEGLGVPAAEGPNRGQSQEVVELPNRGEDTTNNDNIVSQNVTIGDGANSTVHEDGPTPIKKPCFDLVKLSREADKNKWELPEELATHFAEHTKLHFSDVDWKTNMEAYPVPSNMGCVPVMDNNFKKMLKDEGLNTAIDVDTELSNIQGKVEEIMGPLGKAWSECLRYKRGDFDDIDVFTIADQLNMASAAVAHAMQKITYYRRLSSLSSLGKMKNAKDTLREEKVQKIFAEDTTNMLFPKGFDDLLKTEKGSRSNILSTFKPAAPKKKEGARSATSTSGSSSGKQTGSKDRRFVSRKPFSFGPSNNQGGGYQRRDDNRGNNGPRYNNNNRGQGKHASPPTGGQHALISRLVANSETCTPEFNLVFPNIRGHITPGGENPEISGKLENDNQRSSYTRYSQRVGDSLVGNPGPGETSPGGDNERRRGVGNGFGDREHVGQRGNSGSHTQTRPIHQQHFCNPEGRGTISSNYQFETTQQLCPLPPFQNGRSEGREVPPQGRGLDVQARPQGCLLLHSPRNPVTETGAVPLERKVVRVSLPSIRAGPSPQNFYKINESADISTKKNLASDW